MNPIIRPETPSDYPEITEVNNLAFGRNNEGALVDRLRNTVPFIRELSLVGEHEDKIVGHILFYQIRINSENEKYITLALAPMAVFPAYQNRGIGSRLVKEGLKAAKQLGYKSVIVLGHDKYYSRFGFQPAS